MQRRSYDRGLFAALYIPLGHQPLPPLYTQHNEQERER